MWDSMMGDQEMERVGKCQGLNIFISSAFTGKVCCSLPGHSGLCLGPKGGRDEYNHGTEGRIKLGTN